jgi:SAM-dependent methyltransferase
VKGIDFSTSFIKAARQLVESGSHHYRRAIEGEISDEQTAFVPAGIDRSRVSFEVGDATALRTGLGPFDIILAANLLCRLSDPAAFLVRLPELVKPGGQLLLTTPFTWLDGFTPRHRWLGAQSPDAPRSFDVMKTLLDSRFTPQHTADLPFLIREHARKFQYGIAFGSRWLRNAA